LLASSNAALATAEAKYTQATKTYADNPEGLDQAFKEFAEAGRSVARMLRTSPSKDDSEVKIFYLQAKKRFDKISSAHEKNLAAAKTKVAEAKKAKVDAERAAKRAEEAAVADAKAKAAEAKDTLMRETSAAFVAAEKEYKQAVKNFSADPEKLAEAYKAFTQKKAELVKQLTGSDFASDKKLKALVVSLDIKANTISKQHKGSLALAENNKKAEEARVAKVAADAASKAAAERVHAEAVEDAPEADKKRDVLAGLRGLQILERDPEFSQKLSEALADTPAPTTLPEGDSAPRPLIRKAEAVRIDMAAFKASLPAAHAATANLGELKMHDPLTGKVREDEALSEHSEVSVEIQKLYLEHTKEVRDFVMGLAKKNRMTGSVTLKYTYTLGEKGLNEKTTILNLELDEAATRDSISYLDENEVAVPALSKDGVAKQKAEVMITEIKTHLAGHASLSVPLTEEMKVHLFHGRNIGGDHEQFSPQSSGHFPIIYSFNPDVELVD